ncbi:hypothetical protein D0862_07109 [Hortaea werneckii]|uniref:Uncharacterized protein n=1 Tax=Hortaea werneckii TaxID=91943 RepID=A0A3M7GF67_HORWE|nr:hypothetical protein D0862_07109 [Hortaea werneckii]
MLTEFRFGQATVLAGICRPWRFVQLWSLYDDIRPHYTRPTVYIQFDGTWVYESSGYTTSNQSRLLMAHSSTDISSICGTISGIGSPQSFNYGDFNWPVPASAYRCQPKCFEAPPNGVSFVDNATYWAHSDRTFVTLWTYFSSTPWASENQCSTIYDDYKPILSIPPEFSAMTPAVDVGDGITCSFEFNSDAIFYDPPSALAPAASLALPSKPKTNAAQSTSISPIAPTQGPEPSSVPTPSIPKPTQSTTTQGLKLGTDTIIDHSSSRLFQSSVVSEPSQHQSEFSLKTRPATTDQKSYEEPSGLASFPALDPPTSIALTGNDDSPTASPDLSPTNTAMPSDSESYTTAESHVVESTVDISSGNAHDDQSHGSRSAMTTSSANVAAIIATILGAVRATASSTSTDPQGPEPVEASQTVAMGQPAVTDISSSNDPDSLILGTTEAVDGHRSIDSKSMDPSNSAQHFSNTTPLVTQGTSAIAFGAPWSSSSSSNIAKETAEPNESDSIVTLAPSGSLTEVDRSNGIPSIIHTTPRAVISWDGELRTANPAHEFNLEPGLTLQPGKPMTVSGSTVSFDQSASVLVINGVTQSVQSPRTGASDGNGEHTMKDTATATGTATATTSLVSSQDQRVPGASTSDFASQTTSTQTTASTESSAGRSLPYVHAVIIPLSVAILALL